MKYLFKSTLVTLLFTVAFYSSFCQLTHTIELRLGITGELVDPGTTEVDRGDFVVWKIKDGENIQSFNIVGGGHPFTRGLPDPDDYFYSIQRKVHSRPPQREWKYKIFYKLKGDPKRKKLDPKITINPELTNSLTFIIAGVLAVVGGFIAISRYRRKMK